ncbi:MAG TPA: hypothetical protein VK149_03480 [Sideroxyarcus sp.]|nr:hypothetical protein [Sideroxyarcus sp.]
MPERVFEYMSRAGNEPWIVGMLAFFGASFAGLATQLRVGKEITWRAITAAMLNSGFIGAIIALIGYKNFADNLPYLLGISLLAGIGGASMLDFFLLLIKQRIGIDIKIDRRKGD